MLSALGYVAYPRKPLQITKAALATTDTASFVLVQLTASGWQLVVNGELIHYATGVLGDLLAAQTILDKTNPNTLLGTQFCLVYGTSAAEMIATGRMLPIASIPDPGSTTGTSTGSCNVAASEASSPLTGLWWNQNESGWGSTLTQRNSTAMVA